MNSKEPIIFVDEEFVITEEDVIVDKNGVIPSIMFSDRVHDQVDRNMRNAIIRFGTGGDSNAQHPSILGNGRGSRFAVLENVESMGPSDNSEGAVE
ncbi:hypothetical protein V6N12_061024 [Hibiscus sabdariffa]